MESGLNQWRALGGGSECAKMSAQITLVIRNFKFFGLKKTMGGPTWVKIRALGVHPFNDVLSLMPIRRKIDSAGDYFFSKILV